MIQIDGGMINRLIGVSGNIALFQPHTIQMDFIAGASVIIIRAADPAFGCSESGRTKVR